MTSTIGLALVLTVVAGWLVGCATAPASRADKETLLAEAASALQRMRVKGWVLAVWKTSANNRRARFYTLTTAGKKQLGVEESRFSQMFGAIRRVMKTT